MRLSGGEEKLKNIRRRGEGNREWKSPVGERMAQGRGQRGVLWIQGESSQPGLKLLGESCLEDSTSGAGPVQMHSEVSGPRSDSRALPALVGAT